MSFRVICLPSAGLAVFAVLFLSGNSKEQPTPSATAEAQDPAQAPRTTPPRAKVTPLAELPPSAPKPLPAPDVSPELRALLTKLRSTFEAGGSKPSRFRLQRQLSELWSNHPPVDVLLYEASDPKADVAYRAHFAARLRNLAKAASPQQRNELAGTIRESLALQPHGNAKLSQALLSFDQQPSSVRAVSAPLASLPPDNTTAGLLAALSLSDSVESRRIRFEHTRRLSSDPDRFPQALQTSLPPLALRPELEVEPMLQRVLSTTSHFPLYQTAVQSCFFRPPSTASLAALEIALSRNTEFGTSEQELLTQRLRAGLLHWSRQVASSRPSLESDIQSLVHRLP